jgi:histone H1/5
MSASVAPKKSYIDLAKEAIIALKDRSGSSSQAIKAYITTTYPGIKFAQHLLRAALKRGADSGNLIKVKASFKLGEAEKKAVLKKPPTKPVAAKKAVISKPVVAKKTSTTKPTKKVQKASKKAVTKKSVKKVLSTVWYVTNSALLLTFIDPL